MWETNTSCVVALTFQQWSGYSAQYLSVLPALNGSSNTAALTVTENLRLLLGLTEHSNCSIWWR